MRVPSFLPPLGVKYEARTGCQHMESRHTAAEVMWRHLMFRSCSRSAQSALHEVALTFCQRTTLIRWAHFYFAKELFLQPD